jgi:hypothetical protein
MKQALILTLLALFPFFASCGSGGSDVTGSYGLDVDFFVEEFKKNIPAEAPAEMIDPMIKELRTGLEKATFTIKADGTFEAVMSMPGEETKDSGTWVLEGEKITFTTTESSGDEKGKVQEGIFKDGVISIQETMPDGSALTIKMIKK